MLRSSSTVLKSVPIPGPRKRLPVAQPVTHDSSTEDDAPFKHDLETQLLELPTDLEDIRTAKRLRIAKVR